MDNGSESSIFSYLLGDILAMEDAGAEPTKIFSDFGIVTTTAENGPALTRSLLNAISAKQPDVIVVELGDGLIGEYGVDAILSDSAIQSALTGVVLCANDPVAAWGGVQLLKERYDISPVVVTGPATDNDVGVGQIRERLGLEGINALSNAAALGDAIAKHLGQEGANAP